MKLRVFTTIFIGLFLLVTVNFGMAADTIKIGVVAPLSPPGGVETGQAIVDGANVAAEEINQAEKHKKEMCPEIQTNFKMSFYQAVNGQCRKGDEEAPAGTQKGRQLLQSDLDNDPR